MPIYELDGHGPELPQDGNYYIADTAVVIGKVRLMSAVSIWFGAVLRGDNDWMEIGEGTNIQDNCTCHVDPGFPLTVGKNVIVSNSPVQVRRSPATRSAACRQRAVSRRH